MSYEAVVGAVDATMVTHYHSPVGGEDPTTTLCGRPVLWSDDPPGWTTRGGARSYWCPAKTAPLSDPELVRCRACCRRVWGTDAPPPSVFR